MARNYGKVMSLKVAFAFLYCCQLSLSADAAAPNPEIDTVSPAYDWQTFPYDWTAIRTGKFVLTPIHWQRYAGNPVVKEGMNVRPVLIDENTVRVYYGVPGPKNGIFYFDVDTAQPEKIKTGPIGPIISTGPEGSYDSEWVICPEPVRLSETHLRMYFSAKAAGLFFEKSWSLAVADSFDNGGTWQKYAGNPILTATDDPWECGAVGFCSIEHADGQWKMWYLGTNDQQNAVKQVGYATSTDGLSWKRYDKNPIIAVNPKLRWEAGAVAVPRVIRDGQLYRAWYCCYENNDTYAIGQAESIDGIKWFRSPNNPVIVPSAQESWASEMVAYPGVVKVKSKYLMWYSGNTYGGRGIGLATADVPRGKRFYRTGQSATGDVDEITWQPMTDKEPPRTGFIQFAIVKHAQ